MSNSQITQRVGLFQMLDQLRPGKKGARSTGPGPDTLPRQDRRRALVVDDSEDTRRIIERWGSRWGVEVTAAGDAPEAFRLASFQFFDLILLDLHLPSLSGFDALKGLRSILRSRSLRPVPVICLTASVEERNRCLEAGFNGFLEKPIHPPALRALLVRQDATPSSSDQKPEEDKDIRDLLPAFLRNRKKDVAMMTRALAGGNYEHVQSTAHRIRGSAGSFGFPEMSELGRGLERAAAEKDLTSSLLCLSKLAALLRKTEARIPGAAVSGATQAPASQAVESSL